MKEYVLGFMFDRANATVVMIHKNKPEWQKGFLNGVGGKIEPNEAPLDAMEREFKEETGVEVTTWNRFATLRGHNQSEPWRMYCYWTTGDTSQCSTQEDEEIEIVPLKDIPNRKVMVNIPWLLGMVESLKEENASYYDVMYVGEEM